MMIKSIEYLSLKEALEFQPKDSTIAISILSPGRAQVALHPGINPVLRLYFEDTMGKEGASPAPGIFNTNQAREILHFVRHHRDTPEPCHLLVHCEAGISRSAAVAVFAASECNIPLTGQFAFLNSWVLSVLVKTAYPHYCF
ncbi:hypothetical protein MASR1M60_30530 [Rhodocyclaceae bacterium]